MANPYFQLKQFIVYHDRCAMKVTTDACLFGAWIAEEIKKYSLTHKRFLDIGTGTGLLALMVAQKNNSHIDAIEIDKASFEQAVENIQASPWRKTIKVFNADILNFENDHNYDCIISNPPFYENELASLQPKKNTAHHSSQLTIVQVIKVIQQRLDVDGKFFLLLPYKRIEEIENQIQKKGLGIVNKVMIKQSINHKPFRVMIMGTGDANRKAVISEIIICDEQKQYTSEFQALLKDYYLHL